MWRYQQFADNIYACDEFWYDTANSPPRCDIIESGRSCRESLYIKQVCDKRFSGWRISCTFPCAHQAVPPINQRVPGVRILVSTNYRGRAPFVGEVMKFNPSIVVIPPEDLIPVPDKEVYITVIAHIYAEEIP